MRRLIPAGNEAKAKTIVDALLVQGIDAQVRGEPAVEVWVLDDDALPRAREVLAAVERGEVGEVSEQAARLRRKRAASEADWAHRFVDMSRRFHVSKSIGEGLGAVTLLLAAASVIVAIVGGAGEVVDERMWNLTVDQPWPTVPFERVREGEVWRLVTPIFLHFGALHLLFNMLWLWHLGRMIERNDGPWVMAALVLVSAVVGNVGQYWVSGPGFGGMSGVAYGLFGFTWMQSRYRPRKVYTVRSGQAAWMMMWFVLCTTGLVGAIANIGHAAGLGVGLLFGLPAYVGHLRARASRPDFEHEGGWAAVYRKPWQRWVRRLWQPLVPVWFGVVTAVVILREPRDPLHWQPDACGLELRRIHGQCFDQAVGKMSRAYELGESDPDGLPSATAQELQREGYHLYHAIEVDQERHRTALEAEPDAWDQLCPAFLEEARESVQHSGCTP